MAKTAVTMLLVLIAILLHFGRPAVLGNFAVRTSHEQLSVVPQMNSGSLTLVFTRDNYLSIRIEPSTDGKFRLRQKRKIAAPFYYLSQNRLFVLMPLEHHLDMSNFFKAHIINEIATRCQSYGRNRQQLGELIMDSIFSTILSVDQTADHVVKSLGNTVDYAAIVAEVMHPEFLPWQPINTGAQTYSIPPSPIITTIPVSSSATCRIHTSATTLLHLSPRHIQVSLGGNPGAFATVSTGVGDVLTLKQHFQGRLFIIDPKTGLVICYEEGMKIVLRPSDLILYVSDAMKMNEFLSDIDDMGITIDATNFSDLCMAHFAALNDFIMEFPASIIISPEVHRRISQLRKDRRRSHSH